MGNSKRVSAPIASYHTPATPSTSISREGWQNAPKSRVAGYDSLQKGKEWVNEMGFCEL
jgi:hypothetical protein